MWLVAVLLLALICRDRADGVDGGAMEDTPSMRFSLCSLAARSESAPDKADNMKTSRQADRQTG